MPSSKAETRVGVNIDTFRPPAEVAGGIVMSFFVPFHYISYQYSLAGGAVVPPSHSNHTNMDTPIRNQSTRTWQPAFVRPKLSLSYNLTQPIRNESIRTCTRPFVMNFLGLVDAHS